MVAHLLHLKLTLLRNGLRRSVAQLIGLVIGVLYALGGIVAALIGLAVLSSASTDLMRTVLVLAGSVLVLGWWVVPLVAFGVDATLDPARFVTFAVPRRSLLTGLALSGVIGIPGAATLVVVIAAALSWWHHPLAVLVALVCAVMAVATCIVGSRATTTVFSSLVARRRYREVVAVVTILPLALMGPIMSGLSSGVAARKDLMPRLADAAAWTPVGAVWSVPGDVATGDWTRAGLRAAIALATLVALVVVWDRALSRALVTPSSSGSTGTSTRRRGLGLFGRLPATPLGAVVARCLTYWQRDPRYAVAVLVVPVIPLAMYLSTRAGSGHGSTGVLLVCGPLVGVLLGWSISADVSYDSTAFWTHVAAPISGRVDRAGRVIAAAVIGVPGTLAMVVIAVAVGDRWELMPALAGVSLGLLLTALGTSSVVSASVVYPVVEPGQSPFGARQGASMAAFVSQLLGFGAILMLGLPGIVLAVVTTVTGSAILGVVTLVVGLGLGTGVLLLGIRWGGRLLDRGAPELLSRIVAFD